MEQRTAAQHLIVLPFSGALDIAQYPRVRAIFASCPNDAHSVLVDLTDATHVDSVFLTELLLFTRRVSVHGAKVGVLIATEHIERIFSLTNLARNLRVFTNYDEARAGLA